MSEKPRQHLAQLLIEASDVLAQLRAGSEELHLVGSARRGHTMVGDLDVLLLNPTPSRYSTSTGVLEGWGRTMANAYGFPGSFLKSPNEGVTIDVFEASPLNFYSTLVYSTGPRAFGRIVDERFHRVGGHWKRFVYADRGGNFRSITLESEEHFFEVVLGIPHVEPESRDDPEWHSELRARWGLPEACTPCA